VVRHYSYLWEPPLKTKRSNYSAMTRQIIRALERGLAIVRDSEACATESVFLNRILIRSHSANAFEIFRNETFGIGGALGYQPCPDKEH
jgi:hypothetical protein